MTGVLIRRGDENTDIQTEENHVKTQLEGDNL